MTLTLQIQWIHLAKILSGEKTSEYRYVTERLEKWIEKRGDPTALKLTNGYRPNRPTVTVDVIDVDRYVDGDAEVYEFKLGKVTSKVNVPKG